MPWKGSRIYPSFHSRKCTLVRRILEHCHLQTVHAGGRGGGCSDTEKGATEILGHEAMTSGQEWGTTATIARSFEWEFWTFRKKFTEPFTVTGVNFAGPLLYRSEMDQTSNAYVALFTCASTSAFHLGHPNRWSVKTPKRFNLQKLFVDKEAKNKLQSWTKRVDNI